VKRALFSSDVKNHDATDHDDDAENPADVKNDHLKNKVTSNQGSSNLLK
jgi:hypothetical protein